MIVFIALAGVLIALISVAVALFFVAKKRREIKQIPEICTRATVLGTYEENYSENSNFSSATVDGYNAWEGKKYFANFRCSDGKQIRLLINKDIFLAAFDGDSGELRYKGDQFISFEKDTSVAYVNDMGIVNYLNDTNVNGGKKVKFYGSMSSLGMEIFSNAARELTLQQVYTIIDRIYDNKSENFFVLEDMQGVILQFSNDGKSKIVLLEIPSSQPQGAYVGQFDNLDDVKRCVQDYFDGISITFNYPVRFEHW